MKKLLLAFPLFFAGIASAQTLNIDTLAFQDFEVTPAAPVWNFTGPVIYNSGFSGPTVSPPNSPIGIGGSRAWETTTNSGGLVLNFANTVIPAGYDSIRVRFNLAAMNLASSGGGPDNLDYVLVAYSLDGGTTFTNRTRVRGAVNDNSFWEYSATAVGKNYYLPATEQVFQPITSGLQTTMGYSTVEIVFPGTVTQIAMRITGRSSSSTDTWLVDNLVMTGENICTNSTSTLSASACNSYTAPSGNIHTVSGVFNDTIANSTGCDSVITISLSISNSSAATLNASACGSYTLPGGSVVTSSGTYMDTLTNSAGCDSVITVNVTINGATSFSQTVSACNSYTRPGGAVVTVGGTYMDTIPNAAGCDSVITTNLTINASTSATIVEYACNSYTSPAGNVYTTSGFYNDTIANAAGCDSVITIDLTVNTIDVAVMLNGATLTANAIGVTYQWIDCNNGNAPIAGANGQSYLPPVNGDYAVIITDAPCVDTSACVNVMSVGSMQHASNAVMVAPNPFTDKIMITGCNQNAVISIMDVAGQTVATARANGPQTEIDLSAQAAGFYFVEVRDGDLISRIEVIKQ